MKRLRPAAVLAAACLLAGFAAAQDEEIPKIRGRVVGGIGAPIAGAVVHGPGGTVKTDASGVFSIPGNPASEDQMLLVKADGFAVFHLDLTPSSHESEILVRLAPPKVAVVKVVGEDGRPVRNAVVHGRIPFAPAYSALERVDFDAVTDQEGYTVIRGIPADMAVVAELRPQGMVPAQSPPLAPVPEGAPEELRAAAETLTVTPGRSLRLAIENEAEKPVAGAAVLVLPLVEPRLDFGGHASRETSRGSIRAAVTDAAGAVSFDYLPANPVTCEVRATGLFTQLLVVEGRKETGKPVRVRMRNDPDPPATDIPWRFSIPAALAESKKTGRAVFLVMTMDGEKANDWMSAHHYHDREVVRAAREVVPILSSAFGKGGVGEGDGHDEKDGKCTRYGVIPCQVHQQIEKEARMALMETRMVFEVPRHFARTPEGDLLFERVFFLSERDLVRLLARALRLTDRAAAVRVARERLVSVMEDLAHADPAVRKKGARALALLASSGDEHAAALVQGLAALGLPAAVRADILGELHPCGVTSPAATFGDLVRDPDRDVRRALFGRIGEVATDEALLDRLASEIRTNDGPARDALLRALDIEAKGGEITVRAPAAGNRWRLVEELVEAPEIGRVRGLDDALKDVDRPARYRLLRALGRRAAADPALQEVLIRASRGGSPLAALRAIGVAAASMTPPNPMLGTLLEMARSADPVLREEALRAFAASDVPVDAALLAEGLTHPTPAVRVQAALALWRRGDRSGEKILLAAVSDPELGPAVRALLRK
jgi:hypothetical protein